MEPTNPFLKPRRPEGEKEEKEKEEDEEGMVSKVKGLIVGGGRAIVAKIHKCVTFSSLSFVRFLFSFRFLFSLFFPLILFPSL